MKWKLRYDAVQDPIYHFIEIISIFFNLSFNFYYLYFLNFESKILTTRDSFKNRVSGAQCSNRRTKNINLSLKYINNK